MNTKFNNGLRKVLAEKNMNESAKGAKKDVGNSLKLNSIHKSLAFYRKTLK